VGGSIGDGTTTSRPTPVDVSDLNSGVTHIGGWTAHTCAALSTGGLKCWGSNGAGQIGDGTLGGSRLSPVDVVGIGSEIIGIAVGGEHACALLNYGAVKCWGANGNGKCWGDNGRGQIDSGTSGNWALTPVDVVGLL
jgi:alpha-tubulin suppressor-like RCC1 family protein